jgi:ammonia channel protein AmtB
MIFEWGASRRKCAEQAMVKHAVMFAICSITTVLFGFGLAYGDPHILGSKYFLAWGIIAGQENKELTFDLAILILCTLSVSTLSVSALNERQSFSTQIALGVFTTTMLVPVVTAWTFGNGYLAKLYLQDESACLSFHFISGICALVGCYFIEPRICRY